MEKSWNCVFEFLWEPFKYHSPIGFIIGDEGQALDCPAVLTDYTHDRLPSLSLANTMEICAFLKGTGN